MIPGLGRKGRQTSVSSKPSWATLYWSSLKEKQSHVVVAHTFNSSTREVEKGSDIVGQRENSRREETKLRCALSRPSEDTV